MRKTANNIYCVGELITTEFIEETSTFDSKEYRKLNATVRYAPTLECQFTMKYNKYKFNKDGTKGELSVMYDFVEEVFKKYKPWIRKTLVGRESDGKPKWSETVLPEGEKADKVVCKAELVIIERPYLSRQSGEIEIAKNQMLKLNGKYGITHATEKDKDCGNFTLEMIVATINKTENNLLFVNGLGVNQIGDNFSTYPLTLKVPENGVDVILEQFEDVDLKNGVTAKFGGKIYKGKETIQVDEEFDGTPVLRDRNLDELRVTVKAKGIVEYDEDDLDNGALNPAEVKKINEVRIKNNNDKKEKFRVEQRFNGKEEVPDDVIPFDLD
jgi:hypothetical protein